MADLASDLLKHFSTSSPQPSNVFWRHLTGSKSSTHSIEFLFFRADQKSKIAALASDWLEHFSTSSPQPLNGFWRNLTWSKSSTPSIKFVFFVPIRNPRWPPWPLIGWNIFRLLLHNRRMYFDDTWQEASPQHTLSSFCFFVLIRNLRLPPWPLIGLNIFRLLLRNRWMDFDETWQEASPQRPLSSLYFSCQSEIQDGRVASDLRKHLSTSSPQPLNWFWQNLTGSKSSTPSIKFVFLCRSEN